MSKTSDISSLPKGNYTLISWDIDVTGIKLTDEIFQIAACTSNTKFSEYILPNHDISLLAQKRHSMQIVLDGNVRKLKNLKYGRFVKAGTQSDVLKRFVKWLEANKSQNANGILLLKYQSTTDVSSLILLEALIQNSNTYTHFTSLVKGFFDSNEFANKKYKKVLKNITMRKLSHLLLDKNEDLTNARIRAGINHELMERFLEIEDGTETATNVKATAELIRECSRSTYSETEKHMRRMHYAAQKGAFKPVFKYVVSSIWANRRKSFELKRVLIGSPIKLTDIKHAWQHGGKLHIEQLFKESLPHLTETESTELQVIFDVYFTYQKKKADSKVIKPRKHKLTRTSQQMARSSKTSKDDKFSSCSYAGSSSDGVSTPGNVLSSDEITTNELH